METSIGIKVFVLLLLVVFCLVREKGFKIYNPASLLSIIYFLEFGVSSLLMVFMIVNNDPRIIFLGNLSLEALNNGLTFIVLVFLFFLFGFYSPYYNKTIKQTFIVLLNKIPTVNNYYIAVKNLPLMLFLLLIVGWISRLLLIKLGGYYHVEAGVNIKIPTGFQLYAQYINIGSLFPLIALVLIFFEWIKNKSRVSYLLITIILLFIEVVYAVPSGSKERVLLPISIVLFMYSLNKKIILLPLMFYFALFILFLFPFFDIYRSLVLTGDVISDLKLTFFLYQKLFTGFDLKTLSGISYDIFVGRLNYSYVVSVIVDNTPKIWDFKYGYTYFLFLISFIPRIIWHSKPAIAGIYNEFGRDYGFLLPIDYTTSVATTWVGEMFLNFGWFGILCGFFYGILFRFIYSYFLQDKKLSSLSVILYAFSLYYMVRGDNFAEQFSGLFKFYFVMLLIFMPFFKKVKKA